MEQSELDIAALVDIPVDEWHLKLPGKVYLFRVSVLSEDSL